MGGDNGHFKACSHAKGEEGNKITAAHLVLVHTTERESSLLACKI